MTSKNSKTKPWANTIRGIMIESAWADYFGVSLKMVRIVSVERLNRCRDDEARRLILGISR